MATKLFLTTIGPNSGTNEFCAFPYDANALGMDTARTAGGSRQARTTAGVGLVALQGTTITGPSSGEPVGNMNFTTFPLSADVTISGTITFNIWGFENAMTANAGPEVKVWRLKQDGTLVLIVDKEEAIEYGTAASVHNFTATPTSTACLAGECLVIQVLSNDAGGTMGASFVTVDVGGATGGADGDTWVSFTEALTFQSYPTTVTTLYPTVTAGVTTVSGESPLTLSTTQVSGSASVLASSVSGSGTIYPNVHDTNGTGPTDSYVWYSDTLASSVTLTYPLKLALNAIDTANGVSQAAVLGQVYYCDADGSNPVLIATTVGLPQATTPRPRMTSTGDNPGLMLMAGKVTTIPAGKRIRLLVSFIPANFYKSPSTTMVSGGTLQFRFGTTTFFQSRLEFSDTLTFGTPFVARPNKPILQAVSRASSW